MADDISAPPAEGREFYDATFGCRVRFLGMMDTLADPPVLLAKVHLLEDATNWTKYAVGVECLAQEGMILLTTIEALKAVT